MKQEMLNLSVSKAAETVKISLKNKGFTLFADIDHQANAASVGLEMPASRVLIIGHPVTGTKLMQKDIFMSLDLPLRLALVEKDNQTKEDYSSNYHIKNHPVLEKIEGLFSTLISELS